MADQSNTSNYGISGVIRLMSSVQDKGASAEGELGSAQGGAGARDAGQNDLGEVDVGRTTQASKPFSFSWHNWENSIQDLPDASITSIRFLAEGSHDRIYAFDASYIARMLRPKLAKDATVVLIICESSSCDGHGWNPSYHADPFSTQLTPPDVVDHGVLERPHHSRLAVGDSLRAHPFGDPKRTEFRDLPQMARNKWVNCLGRQLSDEIKTAYVQQYTTTSFAAASIMPFDVQDPEGAKAERTVWRRGIRMDLPSHARA